MDGLVNMVEAYSTKMGFDICRRLETLYGCNNMLY